MTLARRKGLQPSSFQEDCVLSKALDNTKNVIHTILFVPALAPVLLHYTCLHAQNGFAVALQASEEESIPGITNTNGTVVRSHNQQLSGPFLSCGQTANCPRAMAYKDFQSFVVLKKTVTII